MVESCVLGLHALPRADAQSCGSAAQLEHLGVLGELQLVPRLAFPLVMYILSSRTPSSAGSCRGFAVEYAERVLVDFLNSGPNNGDFHQPGSARPSWRNSAWN